MNAPLLSRLLFLLGLAASAGVAAAAEPSAPGALSLVVVTPLAQDTVGDGTADADFDRLDLAFRDVARRHQWPIEVNAERFSGVASAHARELRIFLQPLRRDPSQTYVFRAWMALTVDGTKHDLGLITHREQLRYREDMNDFLDKLFRGAAEAAAKKIERILFPTSPRA